MLRARAITNAETRNSTVSSGRFVRSSILSKTGAVRARCAQAGARGRGEAGAGTEAAASPEACRPLPAASGPPARRAEPDRTPFRRRPSALAIWLASWALSVESKKPVTDVRDGLQVTLVAGTRYHLYRTALLWHLGRPRIIRRNAHAV